MPNNETVEGLGADDFAREVSKQPFPRTCQWTNERGALLHFATYAGPTQS